MTRAHHLVPILVLAPFAAGDAAPIGSPVFGGRAAVVYGGVAEEADGGLCDSGELPPDGGRLHTTLQGRCNASTSSSESGVTSATEMSSGSVAILRSPPMSLHYTNIRTTAIASLGS